jgi:hypothetical protein
MQSMLRSCLRWIALYVVIAALLAWLVYVRLPILPVAIGVGAGAAILVWFGVAYVLSAFVSKGGDERLIRKAMAGGRPEDGEKVAVPGTVSGGFESHEAPISRRRAVIYEYKVLPEGRQQAGVYEGFALSPTTIDGPRGAIRILAAPDLDFPHDRLNEPQHLRNLEEYIARTQWTEHAGVDVKREIAHLKTVLADNDGRIRFDIRRDFAPSDDLGRMELREKVVAPGEKVVAIGHFSSARGGLVPHTGEILYSIKILKGEPDEVLRRMKRSAVGHVLLGCGCLTPVILAAIAALAIVPLDAIEQMSKTKDPTWNEVRMEKWLDQNVRSRHEALRAAGQATIELDPGQARGRLDDVRLTTSEARVEDGAVDVKLTSDDGQHGVTIRFRRGAIESAQLLDGTNIPAGALELEQLHEDDTYITGRVAWLSPERNLRASFRAWIKH